GGGHPEAGNAVGRETGDRLLLEGDLAGGRREIARHQVEQGRLAGAVGADDAGDRARLDGEGDVGDGEQAAEALAQRLDTQDGRVHSAGTVAAARRRCRQLFTKPST